MTSPRISWTLIAVAVLLLIGPTGGSAQRASAALDTAAVAAAGSVAIGSRIRITDSSDGSQLVGTLTERSSDGITMELDGGTLRRTPLHYVASAEVHGRATDFWPNFLKVGAAGTLATAIAVAATYRVQRCTFLCIGPQSRGEAFIWGAAGGAIISFPIAAIVGAVRKKDTWTPATLGTAGPPLRDRVRMRVAPASNGVSLGASITFGGGA